MNRPASASAMLASAITGPTADAVRVPMIANIAKLSDFVIWERRNGFQFVPARPFATYVLAKPLRALATVKVPSICAVTLIQ
jgi:hypothetical protein